MQTLGLWILIWLSSVGLTLDRSLTAGVDIPVSARQQAFAIGDRSAWYHYMIRRCQTFNNTTYCVYHGNPVEGNYDPYIKAYDHATGQWSEEVQVGTNPIGPDNNHGNPALLITTNGFLHVMYGAQQGQQQYSISTNAEDISSWTARNNLFSGHTYTELFQDIDGTMRHFARCAGCSGGNKDFTMRTSSDGGASWSSVTHLLESNATSGTGHFYALVNRDSTLERYHMVFHDAEGPDSCPSFTQSGCERRDVYYAYMDISDGIWRTVAGTALTLPIDSAQKASCLVHDTSDNNSYISKPATNSSGRVFLPYVDVATAKAVVAYHNGTSWIKTNVASMARPHENFIAVYVDADDDEVHVYLSSDQFKIQEYASTDGGANYHLVQTVANHQGVKFNAAIVSMENTDHADAKIAWFEYNANAQQTPHVDDAFLYLWGDSGFLNDPTNLPGTN